MAKKTWEDRKKEKGHKGIMDSKAERFENRPHKGPGPYSRKDETLNPATGKSFGCPRSSYDKVIRPGWEKDGQCRTSSKIGELDSFAPIRGIQVEHHLAAGCQGNLDLDRC